MSDFSISVAMCTFNGEQFLESQLTSIAVQTQTPDEVIVCDDGSSDCSKKIVERFSGRVQFPVRLVENETNLGSTKNFEKAIRLCQGSIVVLADQDDTWYRQKLERLRAPFLTSASVVAVFSDADVIDQDGSSLGIRLWPTFGFSRSEQKAFVEGEALSVLIKHPVVTGASMAFRRSLFDRLAPIPADEIHDQWMSFLLAAAGRVELVKEPLLQYRRHRKQQVGPGPASFRGQMVVAASRGDSFYEHEILRFQQLQQRLSEFGSEFPNAAQARWLIENKIGHLKHRARLSRSKLSRVPTVFREALNRNYWRYSGGWVSIAKDLVLR